jgi:hypothetical protein
VRDMRADFEHIPLPRLSESRVMNDA